LHIIGCHHGRSRPHFVAAESYDPETEEAVTRETVTSAPARLARLQRRFGRWGLAYLESLIRAADVSASRLPDATANTLMAGD
jgi:CRISPR-associated endonuclease/helicase Cas3